jgi:hypothetical protein
MHFCVVGQKFLDFRTFEMFNTYIIIEKPVTAVMT